MNIKSSILLRVRIAFLVCILFSLAVVGKVVYLQFVQGEKWKKKAEQITLRYMKLKATRGNIYSDNGSLLATSLPFYRLAMDPTQPDKAIFDRGIDSLARELSAFFKDRSATEYKRKIINARLEGKEYLVLNRSMVDYQDKKKMIDWPIFRHGRLKGGAIFEKLDRRFRPFSSLALRTVGFINEDNKGAGLEYSFNRMLGGTAGEALFQKMAGNNWKPIHDENEVRPEQGLDIQTTIDINLQDVAENSLETHLRKHEADYGCAVLMEVATGEIKAIANLGSDGQGGYLEDYNYAVGNQGLTDPGSTFKLASLMALFEEYGVELSDSIDTYGGKFKFYDRTLFDAKQDLYKKLSVEEVFAKSSNVGVARLVNEKFGSNPDKFLEYIHRFGLDERINFQMAGEAVPYVKKTSDKTWSGVTLPWMSIGYELKVSPLQILTFYNAVANQGKMIQPIIVKAVYKSDKVIKQYESKVLNDKICSDVTLEKAKSMLLSVVEEGTAHNIKNPNYQIAGKTGTAQIIKEGRYTKNYYTSFVGYFPAQKPKYSCIVVINNPKGFNQYGADVSAPVFKEIADKIYARDPEMHKTLEVDPSTNLGEFPLVKAGFAEDLIYLLNEMGISNHGNDDADWVSANMTNQAIHWTKREVRENLVPNVTGFTLKDALYVLENNGLKVRYTGVGRVQSQSLSPGQRILKGSVIYIRLG